jgi:hypothetical protein
MNITTSSRITKFNFKPIWDLSGISPLVRLVNDSVGVASVPTGSFNYSYVSASLSENIVVKNIQWEQTPGNITTMTIDQAFDLTNQGLTDLLAVLNGGGFGSWSGTYVGNVLTLTSSNNPNTLLVFNYFLAVTGGANIPFTRTQTAITANGLTLCKFWFECYLPDGTIFHSASLSAPDRVGTWTNYNISELVPEIMGHIPWGKTFKVRGYVNDGTTTFGPVDQDVEICRPNGNVSGTQNNYGVTDIYTELKCNLTPKKLYVEDRTITSYQTIAGTIFSTLYKLVFPTDNNGDTASSTSGANLSSVLLAIGEDSDCYQLIVETVYDYLLGDTTVRIKYKLKKRLEIFCGLSLCSLQCSIKKFEDRITRTGCTATDQVTLLLINSKFNRLISGLLQPDCGVGVPALIAEIKAMLPKDCGCN